MLTDFENNMKQFFDVACFFKIDHCKYYPLKVSIAIGYGSP